MDKAITNEHLKELLSRKLGLLRASTGQTIEDTAFDLGMDFSEYYRLLKGIRLPHLRTLLRISKKYGVTLDWWFEELPAALPQDTSKIENIDIFELVSSYNKLRPQAKEVVLEMLKSLAKNHKTKET
ncbi:MAG: helix-turn-helix domain-containing protein [Candidatus Margulisbacteria bacterium]|jgi:transcriptional regulator with XRE-family HTH domain|nr:helix-turn-helix domain-containing protein [Candidatus Margulisiibacteriota bacterium]